MIRIGKRIIKILSKEKIMTIKNIFNIYILQNLLNNFII
uniref:Uncharacterized protein n=1 Tax=Clostridium perfringens TaxID=1502 RepID=A0A4Y5T385_CLOPF|nr:hypothetical protein [Clostridium perfringens]